MRTFLRNSFCVLFLQPAGFIDLHPSTLRVETVIALLLNAWISIALPVETVIAFYVLGIFALCVEPAFMARTYGHEGTWRAAFAFAWCTVAAAALSSLADSFLVNAALVVYVFLAISMHRLRRRSPSVAQRPTPNEELTSGVMCPSASPLPAHEVAFTAHGEVLVLETGPTIGLWRGMPIPDYLVVEGNRKWVFSSTFDFRPDHRPQDNQLVLRPGLLYEIVQ
ncbi:hypothetical protein [Ramlibacter sp. AN1133]|uniref:hypothetical protein n=1 Tax=Ramlibacter sp. AN1133 TaxID=3133429 RepID=UPI0030C3ADC2